MKNKRTIISIIFTTIVVVLFIIGFIELRFYGTLFILGSFLSIFLIIGVYDIIKDAVDEYFENKKQKDETDS